MSNELLERAAFELGVLVQVADDHNVSLPITRARALEVRADIYKALGRPAPVGLYPRPEALRNDSPELHDWNQLFQAVTMGGLDEHLRKLANVPPLWPNPWHQDCAMVAFFIHGMQERMRWLAEFLKTCPHAEITHNDDPDEGYVGWSIVVESCSNMRIEAPTLEDCIDLAMKAKPDEDGDVYAVSPLARSQEKT